MRIVVSGTHASGKTTLIDDFVEAHPEYERWGDAFEFVDSALDEPDASTYFEQLVSSGKRLLAGGPEQDVIVERGPLDFLAYLAALETLGRGGRSSALYEQGLELTSRAMSEVDLLVILPLQHRNGPEAAADEDLELRSAMNESLLELSDDQDLTGDRARVIEVVGDRTARLAAVNAALADFG
ncbi:ATP-binding protein [Agromyces endophyticus]|uniref:ATP-binding protein n=1 Tax=Agromyces sp. H17E-10 TaxID=2932244 RepID=UPI001FD18DB1|nr:ATP-binding protein [Agromyces sp. H17E-10]UOQ90174.1 ATP-binding protein [Agromyces sp. H17E-10]